MNREEFISIMSDDDKGGSLLSEAGDNALKGLLIISKYLPKKGIEGADHDIIYSVGVDEIIEAGITIEDTEMLRDQNWMVEDEEYLACYV